jgi:hypothetical protein
VRERAAGLTDRHAECGVLDRLVEAVRAGESRAAGLRRAVEPGDRRPAVHQRALVQYHLGEVFTKLGISSRGHLDRVLPGDSASRPR